MGPRGRREPTGRPPRRRRRAIAVAAVGLIVLAGCRPYFPDGTELTATPLGALLVLAWGAAVDDDEGDVVTSYAVEVDGTVVAEVPAPATTCVLIGLGAGTQHDVVVTATNAAGEWSGDYGGDLESVGRLRATVTAPPGDSGADVDCVAPDDADGDRLPDALETGTGTYLHAGDTGTDPADPDSDDDAIPDGDEVLGSTSGVDLPAMGTSPVHRDLLFELDWFDDSNDCAAHTHRPSAGAISRLTAAFAAAPLANPDGTTGVTVIADYGQGGPFTGGTVVPDADGVIAGTVFGADFLGIRATNFDPAREPYFHYVLLPHRYDTTSASSGYAELPGDDMIVSLQCFLSDRNVGNTLMHEVGHNLWLRHGGNVNTNHKPNYNSVMNYDYQFAGVDTNCTPPGNGVLDYSHGGRADLVESALVEAAGICNGVAWDWNGNSVIDAAPVAADINADGVSSSTHRDYDDWSAVWFGSGGAGSAGSSTFLTTVGVEEQPVPDAFRD